MAGECLAACRLTGWSVAAKECQRRGCAIYQQRARQARHHARLMYGASDHPAWSADKRWSGAGEPPPPTNRPLLKSHLQAQAQQHHAPYPAPLRQRLTQQGPAANCDASVQHARQATVMR